MIFNPNFPPKHQHHEKAHQVRPLHPPPPFTPWLWPTGTGGAKPTVSMACTHHGFVAEAFELNGQLEQVINHVRQRFPKLRVD